MQPPPPRRSGLQLFRRILVGVLLVAISLAAGLGGGAYLYFHQSVSAVAAHSKAVKRAQGSLDEVQSASEPATALVIVGTWLVWLHHERFLRANAATL